MSNDVISKYKIPLFNGKNHKKWSVKMKLSLEIKHLQKYVDLATAESAVVSASSKGKVVDVDKVSTSKERAECCTLLLLAMDDLYREALQILPTTAEV